MDISNWLPVNLSLADECTLLGYDKQILAVLAEHGPLTTGELANRLTVDKTSNAVRDRCRLLMGLDETVDIAAATNPDGLVEEE